MEGVMMRAPHSYCVAVRKPNGEIVTEEMPLARMSEQYKIFKLPGLSRLRNSVPGPQTRREGAEVFGRTPALDDPEQAAPERTAQGNAWLGTGRADLFSRGVLHLHLQIRAAVPRHQAVRRVYPALEGRIAFNSVDGVIRLAILLALLSVLSRTKDIRRDLPVSRRRTQSRLQLRIRAAGQRGERAAFHHLSSALRHQLPVRRFRPGDSGLRAHAVRDIRRRSCCSGSCWFR